MASALKIATYNVNGVNGRLPRLLEWLDESYRAVAPKALVKILDEREMDPAAGVRRRRLPAD